MIRECSLWTGLLPFLNGITKGCFYFFNGMIIDDVTITCLLSISTSFLLPVIDLIAIPRTICLPGFTSPLWVINMASWDEDTARRLSLGLYAFWLGPPYKTWKNLGNRSGAVTSPSDRFWRVTFPGRGEACAFLMAFLKSKVALLMVASGVAA